MVVTSWNDKIVYVFNRQQGSVFVRLSPCVSVCVCVCFLCVYAFWDRNICEWCCATRENTQNAIDRDTKMLVPSQYSVWCNVLHCTKLNYFCFALLCFVSFCHRDVSVFFLWNFERWNSTLYTIRMENYASGFLLYILILVFPYFHIYLLALH